MKHLSILIFLLLFSLGFSQAYPERLSLQEAIDYALENNRIAKNAARDIEVAKKQKWETIATGLPQLDASINYQNFLKQQVSVIPAEFFGGNPGEFAEVIFGTKQNATATATLNQLIFDGSYIVGLQSTKVFLEISKNAKDKTDLEVREAVINAYGNVLVSIEGVKIIEKNISVIQDNLDETTKIYENGLEELESVEQLQITLSNLQSDYDNLKRLEVIAFQMLNITLGIEYSAPLELTDTLESLAFQNLANETINAESDVTVTLDYQIADNDKRSKELLVKLEQSKALPRLSGFINGGYNTFADDFVFLDNNTEWFGFSLLGLNLDIPIFSSGMRGAATQRAKINLEKAKDDLTEVEQLLKLQIATAKSKYQFATEDYFNKKRNLDLAERIAQKNETKFFEGIGSSFELRQAQTQLYSAQQQLLQTMLDVINAKAELETITNTPSKY
ncbi:TolC family protein [Winogradskyella sp. KYW1333]|uniref:TolC family protein n=1 Tax=Winogradskyella sp. KYW1333 TaxID=2282123 RepID=UPI000DF2E927|nr:TolC family protein [Winogradskyella sp. KYW1333]RCT55693.1 TolC family protein [Winogradskyella sp. KYW1333]